MGEESRYTDEREHGLGISSKVGGSFIGNKEGNVVYWVKRKEVQNCPPDQLEVPGHYP